MIIKQPSCITAGAGSGSGWGDRAEAVAWSAERRLIILVKHGLQVWIFVANLSLWAIELTPLSTSNTFFDLDANGFAQLTGWVRPDDGLLARDVNGDGVINNITELFGANTQTGDGFAALRTLDSNNDGLINASDAAFVAAFTMQINSANDNNFEMKMAV